MVIQAQSACQSGGPQLLPVPVDIMRTFEMMPSSGLLKPGERVNVQVVFAPDAEVAGDCNLITECND